jgi:tetratricopeptide (TPR) repeat protein
MVIRITVCLAFIFTYTVAQVNYQQQYASAKALYAEGKYNLAMESFKTLIAYDKSNPFSEYASFYYAVSAYRQGYKSVARDMFSQIRQLYPAWEQLDEVSLWMARIHFDSGQYFQAIQQLAVIKDPKLQKEVSTLKRSGLSGMSDVDALTSMHTEYPKDPVIGEKLAFVLSKQVNSREDKQLLEKLITQFKLNRSLFIEETPATVYKDVYSVSVLFPFLVNSLEPTTGRKRNQFILDLYEGMKLAVDTLRKQGISISLRAYDTERSPAKIKSLLERPELKSSDLIVGPVYQEENKLIQEFSRLYKINLFNPVSNNIEMVRDNPYGFLFQPALETLGEESARFLDRYQTNKKCLVLMGDTRRDSALAVSFVKEASATSLKIIKIEKYSKESSGRILQLLATPTEYDEFKYPKQFTLPKDSVGCIFVASDDPLIYTKVINSVTTRGDKVTIVGSENWLDQTADYEKFQALGVVMFASNFTSNANPAYKVFQNKFMRTHGRVPSNSPYSNYAKLGYDFMLFAGTMLKKHGVYFQDGLATGKVTGFLTEGYDFQYSRDNHLVPFIKFEGGELVLLNEK